MSNREKAKKIAEATYVGETKVAKIEKLLERLDEIDQSINKGSFICDELGIERRENRSLINEILRES